MLDHSSSSVDPHLGHLENRPKISEFPFLEDIRRLRRDTRQSPTPTQVEAEPSKHRDHAPSSYSHAPSPPSHTHTSSSRTEQVSPPPLPSKSVRFSTSSCAGAGDREVPASGDLAPVTDPGDGAASSQADAQEAIYSEARPHQAKERRRGAKVPSLRIDERTNVSKLADQMIPQLSSMQRNLLGLLFFNELSPNIVDDIVAQQLSMMPGSKLASVLSSLDPQVQLIRPYDS